MLAISWGLVCNLFDSVYLNWDPSMFTYNKIIHGCVNLILPYTLSKLSVDFSLWREHTAESGEHAGRLIGVVYRIYIYSEYTSFKPPLSFAI